MFFVGVPGILGCPCCDITHLLLSRVCSLLIGNRQEIQYACTPLLLCQGWLTVWGLIEKVLINWEVVFIIYIFVICFTVGFSSDVILGLCSFSIARQSSRCFFLSSFLCLRQHREGILIRILFILELSGEILRFSYLLFGYWAGGNLRHSGQYYNQYFQSQLYFQAAINCKTVVPLQETSEMEFFI